MFDEYTKIVYQSDPIGNEKIVLYLTTFDIHAFQGNKDCKKIPVEQKCVVFESPISSRHRVKECDFVDALQVLENQIKIHVDNHYIEELEKMKNYIEFSRGSRQELYEIVEFQKRKIKQLENSINCDKI